MKNKVYYEGIVPILQNRVFDIEKEAIEAKRGEIKITHNDYGLIHNCLFDPELMIYDTNYDNTVASDLFSNYYDSIIEYLNLKYDLASGHIIDIGCGKGTFLKKINKKYPSLKAIGIDPSYEDKNEIDTSNLKFISEYFNSSHLNEIDKVSLVILRHTLEHIPNPSEFLLSIFEVFKSKFPDEKIPFFIEVPDFEWIHNNRAFWDFCYEHTNYFTENSMRSCMIRANSSVMSIKKAFGNQYLWCECVINAESENSSGSINVNENFDDLDFNQLINDTFLGMQKLKNTSKIVIWGMATKGVMYSMIMKSLGLEIDYAIDMNVKKQHKHAPISGLKILSPDLLPKSDKLSIFVMNPNYTKEITEICNSLGLNFDIYNPHSL